MKYLTNRIEQIRKENAMKGLLDENGDIIKTEEEIQMQSQIAVLKTECTQKFHQLKEVKSEIDRI